MLHLIDFDEPFGYSVVEAMACGTPVIVYPTRSMPEIVENGHHRIPGERRRWGRGRSQHRCGARPVRDRASAVKRFDVATMVDRYVGVYRGITGDRQYGAID